MKKEEIKKALIEAIDKIAYEEATIDNHIEDSAKEQIDKFCNSAEGKKFLEKEIKAAIRALIREDDAFINDILYKVGLHNKVADMLKKANINL